MAIDALNGMLVIRCVVGGTTVVGNDKWQFIDTRVNKMNVRRGSVKKKPSKWKKIAKYVKSNSSVETVMRDAIFAAKMGKKEKVVDVRGKGGNELADVNIAQDPVVCCLLL